jgi:hypothetical protein
MRVFQRLAGVKYTCEVSFTGEVNNGEASGYSRLRVPRPVLVRLAYVVTIQVLFLGVNYAGEAHPTCVVDTGRAPKDSNKYAKFEISKKKP